MAAISHSSALTRTQQILRISAQHFAIRPHQDHPAPRTFLIASEFKDPLPLRWGHTIRHTSPQAHTSIHTT